MTAVRRFYFLSCVVSFATLLMLGVASQAFPQTCNTDLHNTMPAQDSDFLPNLQTMICNEEAQKYTEEFHDMVFSGGFSIPDPPYASLTNTPGAPTIATINGHYAVEHGAVTLTNNRDCWVIMDELETGNLDLFIRQTGTKYLVDCRAQNSEKPGKPAGTTWLFFARTAGGSITQTLDLRSRVPWGEVVQFNREMPTTDRKVDFQYSLEDKCLYFDTGEGWTAVLDSRYLQAVTFAYSDDSYSLANGASTCRNFSFPGVQPGYRCLVGHAGLGDNDVLISGQAMIGDLVHVCVMNISGGLMTQAASSLKITCYR